MEFIRATLCLATVLDVRFFCCCPAPICDKWVARSKFILKFARKCMASFFRTSPFSPLSVKFLDPGSVPFYWIYTWAWMVWSCSENVLFTRTRGSSTQIANPHHQCRACLICLTSVDLPTTSQHIYCSWLPSKRSSSKSSGTQGVKVRTPCQVTPKGGLDWELRL